MLPVPPALVEHFNALWVGRPHTNHCAKMVDGLLVVTLPSPDARWLVYDSDETATLAKANGVTLTIEGDRGFSGRICYGVAKP